MKLDEIKDSISGVPIPTDKNGGNTMRELNIGSKRFTKVVVLDEPGAGGACHEYEIVPIRGEQNPPLALGKISFQNGPIQENGVNGLHHEDLIAVVIDRLQSFQRGDFRCRDIAVALTKLEEALMWLDKRTIARQEQGVEGTSVQHTEA